VPAVPARRIITLPGDGIGPEILAPTLEVLNELGDFASLLQPGSKRVCEGRLACAGGAKELEDHVPPARRC